MNEHIEVKSCPFCGRNVTIKKRCLKDWKGEVVQRFYRIACSCGAGTHKEYKTEKAVTDVWNRRVRIDEQLTIKAEPCTFCVYNPPSSCDGKPCTICPAHKRSDSE